VRWHRPGKSGPGRVAIREIPAADRDGGVTNSARATRNPRAGGFLRPDCGDSLLSCLDDKCPRIASALRLLARVYRKGSAAAAAAAAAAVRSASMTVPIDGRDTKIEQ